MDKGMEFHIHDTEKHQKLVQHYLENMVDELNSRASLHDMSKLQSPEMEGYSNHVLGLHKLTYGSEEYKKELRAGDFKEATKHHYEANRHHPEHYENGVRDMDLVDVMEMLADWCAAAKRHDDGNIMRSIEINQKRFNLSDDLIDMFKNTIKNFNMD